MHNQNESQQFQESSQMSPQQNHGGHSLLDADEAIGALVGGLEQYIIFSEHIQDQELSAINQRQRAFLGQMYNTIIETMKSGQDPQVPTQQYQMEMSNEVTYGLQSSQPKAPIQSSNELTDECISTYMMGQLKMVAQEFTQAALESTNPVLRRVFADSIPNVIEMAYEVFLYQNNNQYYQVPQLSAEDMQTIQNTYAPVQGQMPH